MPGRVSYWKDRCRECGGIDPLGMGLPIHKPTCSESPGYEQARMREAVARAKRRADREKWLKSDEAKRLRDLRTARLSDHTPGPWTVQNADLSDPFNDVPWVVIPAERTTVSRRRTSG